MSNPWFLSRKSFSKNYILNSLDSDLPGIAMANTTRYLNAISLILSMQYIKHAVPFLCYPEDLVQAAGRPQYLSKSKKVVKASCFKVFDKEAFYQTDWNPKAEIRLYHLALFPTLALRALLVNWTRSGLKLCLYFIKK